MNIFLNAAIPYCMDKKSSAYPIRILEPVSSCGLLVIGGTYVRVARYTHNSVTHLAQKPIGRLRSGDELVHLIGDCIQRYVQDEKEIRINIAFALKQLTRQNSIIDCAIVASGKGHDVSSLYGIPLQAHLSRLIPHKKILVLNDCEVLSRSCRHCDLACIVGTGINMAYISDGCCVNFEIGKCTQVPIPIQYSTHTMTYDTLEQIIGGAYLPRRVSDMVGVDCSHLSLPDIMNIPHYREYATEVLHISAQYAAYCIELGLFTRYASRDTRTYTIHAEGGLFWDAHGYKEIVQATLFNRGINGIFTRDEFSYYHGLVCEGTELLGRSNF